MGIIHEKTNPRTPQENGVAERVNRTLVTMTIAMLKCVETQLGRSAWPYTIRHATLIKNVSPHSSLPDDITPYERYTGNKPSVSMIRSLGCKATIHTHHDLHCNVCTPQAESTLRNPEVGSAYRLSPQSPEIGRAHV